ncbi:MAG: acyl carrier protein [Oscillospiraceae bacterium]
MVLERVIKTLASQLSLDEKDIRSETDIIEDLGADSLDLAELMMNLEEEFGIVITDEAVSELHTVQDVADFVEKYI